eukprot:2844467-Ditylum_brightwellii.AAC.1
MERGTKDTIEDRFDPNIANNLPEVNHWLQYHIRRVASPGSIKVELSLDEYKDLIKNQDESTSSSPSGRHYGHYRAALGCNSINLDSHTPDGRRQLIACFKKDPGNPKRDWLWIIAIVEGDTNKTMKVIWNRRLVPVAETT